MNMKFDSNSLNDLAERITEIDLAVERLQAVTQSFAEDYIDETRDDKTAAMYIGYRREHFCRLFHTIAFMVADLENMTKALDDDAATIIKDHIDKIKAGVS